MSFIKQVRIIFCGCLLLFACQLPFNAATPTPAAVTAPSPTSPPPRLATAPTAAANALEGPLQGQPLPLPEVEPEPLFAPFEAAALPPPAAVPRYALSLPAVANPAALPLLTPDERATLERDGFVILAEQLDSPALLFERAARQEQPFFIGADWIALDTLAVHQAIWRETEEAFLLPQLGRLLETLAGDTAGQRREALRAADPDPLLLEAAQRNLAYLTIAGKLLNPDFPLDPEVQELVQSELDLILLGGRFVSPYTGFETDYAPFLTAGTRFERARLWLTRTPLPIDPSAADARLQGRQMLLLWELLRRPETAALWDQVYRPLAFRDGAAAARGVWPALTALNLPLDVFILTAGQLDRPFFTLLPLPDRTADAVFTALTYNRVGLLFNGVQLPLSAEVTAAGAVRLYPRPLDLAAALGSDSALAFLTEAGDTAFDSYDEQLAGERDRLGPVEAAGWTSTYPRSLLFALQPLLEPISPAAPPFMGGEGWKNHQLDSWVVAAMVGQTALPLPLAATGESPRPAAGLTVSGHVVEPQPALYGRLIALTRQLRVGLAENRLLTAAAAGELLDLEARLATMQAVSQKMIGGEGLSPEEAAVLAAFPGRLRGWVFPRSWPFHTAAGGAAARALELTRVRPLVIITLVEGRQSVAVGAAPVWREITP